MYAVTSQPRLYVCACVWLCVFVFRCRLEGAWPTHLTLVRCSMKRGGDCSWDGFSALALGMDSVVLCFAKRPGRPWHMSVIYIMFMSVFPCDNKCFASNWRVRSPFCCSLRAGCNKWGLVRKFKANALITWIMIFSFDFVWGNVVGDGRDSNRVFFSHFYG
jgi:hypothetical protein